MYFVTAFLLVLYKYTNQSELIIGSPTAGRDLEELQNVVGMFVNNIVLYNFINIYKYILSYCYIFLVFFQVNFDVIFLFFHTYIYGNTNF